MYLTFEEVDVLLKQIGDLCIEGSFLLGNVFNRELFDFIQKMKSWEKMGSVLKSYFSQPDELVRRFGFDCDYYCIGKHEEANFGKYNYQEISKEDLKKHFVFLALKK